MAGLSRDNNQKDCIATNIPSRAFRYATESKNVLDTAGAMYIGTGLKRETTMTLADESTGITYESYITAVLECPSDNVNDYTFKPLQVYLYD